MNRRIILLLALLCLKSIGIWADDDSGYAAKVIIGSDTIRYTSFTVALNVANKNSGSTLVLLGNRKYNENGTGLFNVTKSITIDGNGYTLSGYGVRETNGKTYNTTLAINYDGKNMIDVTIKNLTIKTNGKDARPIETRGNIGTLTLEDVTITATDASENKGLTIGGGQTSTAKVYIKNSVISVGDKGYPFDISNPADAVLENCTFSGGCGIICTSGSRGTTIKASNSAFDVSAANSEAALFQCTDDGISMELDDCIINAKQSAASSCSLFSLSNTASNDQKECSVTIKGENTKVNAAKLISTDDGSSPVTCLVYGGIYSVMPDASYIAPGKTAAENTDDATSAIYRYTVTDENADLVSGTVYAGSSDPVSGQTLEQFAAVRKSTPNAIMIVDEKYAEQVKNQPNVIIKYSAGTNGNYLYECPEFELTDWVTGGADNCADFYTPVNFIAVSGSYTRSLHENSQTCCLPFGVSSTDSMKIQIFSYYENAGDSRQYAYFIQPDSVSAGVPCLLNCDDSVKYTKQFKNTEIAKVPNNAYNMKGTFVASGEYSQAYCYGMMDTGAQFGAAPATLYPFRTVLSLQDDSGSGITDAKSITIAVLDDEGNATAIDGTPIHIPNFNTDKSIYTITGIKVADTHIPGLYIIHGRKVLAK